ncbi:MAG: hypothetical protein OQL20_09170 [Sedimenticola sp.]|nr:hypothetical protein [Sedimenticola sp.]
MSPEAIAASASAVIALCALLLTASQASKMREHNRISVRPHLTTWNSKDFEKGSYGVYLLNNGIGPALIKKFEIRVDNKVVSGEGTEPIEKALKIVLPNQPYKSQNAYLAAGFALGAKENICISLVQFLDGFSMGKEEVEHAAKRTDLIIEYESFYGEKYALDTRD